MPTDCRVVLQFKAECFARGSDTVVVASRPVLLQAPIPYLTGAILRRHLVHQTAEAKQVMQNGVFLCSKMNHFK